MSRRRSPPRRAQAAPGPSRRLARRTATVLYVGLALAGALVAALLAVRWQHHAPQPAAGALAGVDPRVALSTALTLGRDGRHLASLPYFRRALESTGDSWEPHVDYATALFNASFQIAVRAHVPCAVTRSSWERIALVREAMQQIDIAERLARQPQELALVQVRRAMLMRVWGLPWEALLSYRRAQASAPEWVDLGRQTDDFGAYLRMAGTTRTGSVDPAPSR